MCYVDVCVLETSRQTRLWPAWGRSDKRKKLKYDFEASIFDIIKMLRSFSVRQNSTTMRMVVCNTAAKGRGKRVVRDVLKVQK
jgi:hypothetical protein